LLAGAVNGLTKTRRSSGSVAAAGSSPAAVAAAVASAAETVANKYVNNYLFSFVMPILNAMIICRSIYINLNKLKSEQFNLNLGSQQYTILL